MKIFYVLYIKDNLVGPYLDLIKIICNPETASRVHLTVRGPYKGTADKKRNWRSLEAKHILITDVGSFFFDRQNTVYLSCSFPGMREVWKKPDFPDGVGHLTLHDGKSKIFAEKLLSVLSEYSWEFEVKTGKLEPLISNKKEPNFLLYLDTVGEIYESIFSSEMSFEMLKSMNDDARLDAIKKICEVLHREYHERHVMQEG